MATKILSRDGSRLIDVPDDTPSFTQPIDALNSLQQQLVAALPSTRPKDRLGGLAATREAERARARAGVERMIPLATMRAHGNKVRDIATKYVAAIEAAKGDIFLSPEGKRAKMAELKVQLGASLLANAESFKAAETSLLSQFSGRGNLFRALRETKVSSTVTAASALALLLPSWPPERALEVLEGALASRDQVTLYYITPLFEEFLGSDPRYAPLASQVNSLLEDATLALGDEAIDAKQYAEDLANAMRDELTSAHQLVAQQERWDEIYDRVESGDGRRGIMPSFDAPSDAGENDLKRLRADAPSDAGGTTE